MKKLMKIALEEEQIRIKSLYDRFDGYEIHLHSAKNDQFELIDTIDKPIYTIHYPIEYCDVYDVVNEYTSDYAQTVFKLCKKFNAGLVIHAETPLDHLLTNEHLDDFCRYMKELGIRIHVENCYRYCGAGEGLKVMEYLREHIDQQSVYPLLDTCHLMMSEMSFRFKEMSFFETIEAYNSDYFFIHLNDCIGSGEKETGGKHGTNFYANSYLLRNIIWMLHEIEEKGHEVKLVLEVDEVDYTYPTNAHTLAKNVDKFWQSYQNN